ncbi:MAG: hypothetical protein IJK56_02320 [Firmicutes bacterium]|nr:hypothetical protein [Bacillota bacterium]
MAIDQNQDNQNYVPQDSPSENFAQNADPVNQQFDPFTQQAAQQQQQFADYTQNTQQQYTDYTQNAQQQYTDYTQAAQQQFSNYTQETQQQFANYTQDTPQQYSDFTQNLQDAAQSAAPSAEPTYGFQQQTTPYEPVPETPVTEEKVEKFDTISDLSASVPVDSFTDPNAGLEPEPFAMPGVSKAFTIFQKNGSSVAVLIGAILLGITVLYALVNPILLWTHSWPQVQQLMAQMSKQAGIALPASFLGIDIQNFMYWSVIVMTVLITLPMILYAIGLCMYSIRARRHEMPGDEDVGLTPLKAGMIIYMVFWILTMLGCGYAIYTSVRALLAGVKLSAEVWTVLILQACWLIIEILGLIYFIKSIRMVKSAERVFAAGEMPKHNLPLFVIVINYILIVLNIVMAFPMVLAGDYAVPVLLNFAMLILRVAAGLLLNIPLHIARSELKRARESE